ncbi:MAG TPA: ABC transporter substrate-binding protein [Oligoflexia bacterium]|nr:ABC transporter substrate-binding protein [Oligoflexia bacterium]
MPPIRFGHFGLAYICALVLFAAPAEAAKKNKSPANAPRNSIGVSVRLAFEAESLDWTRGDVPIHLINNVVEGLYEISADGRVVPAQALKLPKQIGPSRWEIRLKPRLKWSDGLALTAQDYVYAWNRLRSKELASSYSALLDDVASYRASDANTLEIITKKNVALEPALFTHWCTFPVSSSHLELHGEKWTKNAATIPVNGPYRITSGNLGTGFTLAPNSHHRSPGTLKKIEFLVIADDSTALRLYETGRLHFMTDLAGVDRLKIRSHADYRSVKAPVLIYLAMDLGHSLFSVTSNRRIIAEAIDRRSIERVLDGLATPSKNLSPDQPITETDAAYSLPSTGTLAGARFDFAFYEKGSNRNLVELIQNEFKKKLHIDATLITHDVKTYWAKLKERPFPLFLNSYGPPIWSSSYYFKLLTSSHPQNLGRWSNLEYDKAVEQSNWRKAALIFSREQPIIPLYFRRFEYLQKPELKNVILNPMTSLYLKKATLDAPFKAR